MRRSAAVGPSSVVKDGFDTCPPQKLRNDKRVAAETARTTLEPG
jgi:hypothetical protein